MFDLKEELLPWHVLVVAALWNKGSILAFFLTRVFSSKIIFSFAADGTAFPFTVGQEFAIRRKPSHLCFFDTILSVCNRVLWYWVPMSLVCFFHYETLADITSINVVHPNFYFGLYGLYMKYFLHGIDIPPGHLLLLVTDVGDDFARFFTQVNVSNHSLIVKADIESGVCLTTLHPGLASCWAFVYIWLQVLSFASEFQFFFWGLGIL